MEQAVRILESSQMQDLNLHIRQQLSEFGLNPIEWIVIKGNQKGVYHIINKHENWFRFRARLKNTRIWELALDVVI